MLDTNAVSRSMKPVESKRLVCSRAKGGWKTRITDEPEELSPELGEKAALVKKGLNSLA